MEEALKGISEAKERKNEVGKKAKLEQDTEKVVKVLAAVPGGETQAAICKMAGLQARIVGPVLTALLETKKVVRTQIRKSSGQGEKQYDAWRLASSVEFMAAKIEEMGLLPPGEEQMGLVPPGKESEGQEKRPAECVAKLGEEKDTDWLDKLQAGRAEQ
jgi:alkylated DNA nucleotide flippase Atl1